MTFYDRTKEDVRPWREYQDEAGQAVDDAKLAKQAEIEAETEAGGVHTGITLTPATVTVGDTVDLAPTANLSHVTWDSSDDTKATVDNQGVVTGVAAGTATITATQAVKGVTSQTSGVTVTVEAE